MNKLKFIPTLAVVALLSACGASKSASSVKEPKFEKEGSQIESDEFFLGVQNGLDGMDIFGEKKIGSKVANSSSGTEIRSTLSNSKGKLIVDQGTSQVYEYDVKNDAKNFVGVLSGKDTNKQWEKMVGKQESSTARVSEYKVTYQQIEYDGDEYFGMVDEKAKLFATQMQITEANPIADAFDYYNKSVLEYASGLYEIFDMLDEVSSYTSFEGYTFYKNGNTYTYVSEVSEDPEETRNDEDVLLYVTEFSYKAKFQVTINGNDLKGAFYSCVTQKTTYHTPMYTNGYDVFEGDVAEITYKNAKTMELKDKNLSLKPVSYEGYQFTNY